MAAIKRHCLIPDLLDSIRPSEFILVCGGQDARLIVHNEFHGQTPNWYCDSNTSGMLLEVLAGSGPKTRHTDWAAPSEVMGYET
jgi:hypothetical protein